MNRLGDLLAEKLTNENVLVALIPVLAAFGTFVFQASYLYYFGVPLAFIDLDLNKIILSMSAIILCGYLYTRFVAFLIGLMRNEKWLIAQWMGWILFPTLFFIPFVYLFWKMGWYLTALMLMIVSVAMGIYLRIQKARENGQLAQIKQTHWIFDSLEFLVLFAPMYMAAFGVYFASSIKSYEYLKSNPDALFVTRMNDSYIFALVDPKTSVFGKELLVVSASEKIELIRMDKNVKSYLFSSE